MLHELEFCSGDLDELIRLSATVSMAVPKKNNKKRNSIYTLAEDLNLNPGTVSRALRNRPEVSEETRMQVQKRADELGFKLQRFRPRTINVCVLVQTVSTQESIFSSYVNAVMDGLWRYCMQNDLELSLYSAPIDKLNAGFLVRQLANRGVNGVVVVNASDDSRYFRLLQGSLPLLRGDGWSGGGEALDAAC